MTAPIAAYACTRCRDTRHVEPGCGIGSGDFACTGCCPCTAEPKPGMLEAARKAAHAALDHMWTFVTDPRVTDEAVREAHVAVDALAGAERAKIAALTAALHKIAFEPIGDPEATDHDVICGIAEIARAALECEIRAFKGEGR